MSSAGATTSTHAGANPVRGARAAAVADLTGPSGSAPPRAASPWPRHLNAAAGALSEWLCRPRVRLTVTGVVLLFVGGLLVTSSVWTLPLVIAGALMVLIAWIGHRLEGRLAVEWGEAGTQLEFRALIRPAEVVAEVVAEAPGEAAPRLVSAAEPEPDDAVVIEGEAHTVEIEVAALKTLIAAAEAGEAETAQAEASAQAARILRVAHGGGRSSEAS